MADLVPYFVGRLPGYLAGLQEAHAAGDVDALKPQAHDLKAIGGGYGYPQLSALGARLEAILEAAPEQVGGLIAAFDRLAGRIEAGIGQAQPREEVVPDAG